MEKVDRKDTAQAQVEAVLSGLNLRFELGAYWDIQEGQETGML